eukprot:TRINITY_DN6618_c0_g1_i1.p1 TRINITY_DN6618_c0_g1~~TRINITY_DN6618_c0_g1_i1.p1  ORF type:complete len:367 (+),score=20.55 TRINITY_DN6618_c0_g1_i1:17-1117(+)
MAMRKFKEFQKEFRTTILEVGNQSRSLKAISRTREQRTNQFHTVFLCGVKLTNSSNSDELIENLHIFIGNLVKNLRDQSIEQWTFKQVQRYRKKHYHRYSVDILSIQKMLQKNRIHHLRLRFRPLPTVTLRYLRRMLDLIDLQILSRVVYNCEAKIFEALMIRIKKWMKKGLPDDWPVKRFDLSRLAETQNFVLDLAIPNTRIMAEANWNQFPGYVTPYVQKLTKVLSKVESLSIFNLHLDFTRFTDEGCKHIAVLLQKATKITALRLHMQKTEITDLGLASILTELPSLPLQKLLLDFGSTKISDQSLILLSQALCQLSSKFVSLEIYPHYCHGISDNGVIELLNAISSLPVSYTHLTLPTIYSV